MEQITSHGKYRNGDLLAVCCLILQHSDMSDRSFAVRVVLTREYMLMR